ncbi:hypothetical protein PQX77_010808 [Marasmius sp. AFHP31]|nr:hypothetical protein PQX77_010808 [Marasmius sp. AFHP31]
MLAVAILSLAAIVAAHPMQLHGRGAAQVITSCVTPNTAALTFDDGPYQWMDQIADTLDANQAKGTFFLNGQNWDCIYGEAEVGRVQRTYSKGHQIASHTWAHAHLNSLSKDQITSEFTRTQDAIEKITGAKVAFTRPPYGEYNDIVEQVASEQNQALVLWDFDSADSAGADENQIRQNYIDLVARKPSNVLTLNHEVHQTTVNELQNTINTLKTGGYNLVTVAECLGMQPYLSVGSAGQPDASWAC